MYDAVEAYGVEPLMPSRPYPWKKLNVPGFKDPGAARTRWMSLVAGGD